MGIRLEPMNSTVSTVVVGVMNFLSGKFMNVKKSAVKPIPMKIFFFG